MFNETLLLLVGCDMKLMILLLSCESRLQKLLTCNAHLIATDRLTTLLNDKLYDLHVASSVSDSGFDVYKHVYEMMKITLINAEKRKQLTIECVTDDIDENI